MKTMIFAMRDNNARLIINTIYQKREGPAIRAFHEALSTPDTLAGKYPQDFDLLCVGYMDDETGQLTPHTPPEVVTRGQDWLDARRSRDTDPNGLLEHVQ